MKARLLRLLRWLLDDGYREVPSRRVVTLVAELKRRGEEFPARYRLTAGREVVEPLPASKTATEAAEIITAHHGNILRAAGVVPFKRQETRR